MLCVPVPLQGIVSRLQVIVFFYRVFATSAPYRERKRKSEKGIGYEKAIIAFIMLIKAGTQMAASRMDCMRVCVCERENVCDSLRVCVFKRITNAIVYQCVCVCVCV